MINSTRCAFMAKQACATFSKVVRKITPPHANNLLSSSLLYSQSSPSTQRLRGRKLLS